MPARSTYHCDLAWLGGDHAVAEVTIEIDDDRIVAVTPGSAAPPEAIRLRGLTLPGLANAHSHAFHRALRGRTHGGVGSFWTWRDQMYGLAGRLDPDSYHRLARATFAEMAMAGVTCVGEFHYLHHQPDGTPYRDPNVVGQALVAAAADAGVRITLLDTCYLRGGIDQAPEPVQRRFSDVVVDRWVERADAMVGWRSPHVRIGAAVHSVRAVDPDSIAEVAGWASLRGVPLHAHVSEQPAENHACVEAYALTPTELLSERGALDAHFTAVHATHLTEHDVRLLQTHRSSVCMCPTTERDLADGIGPTAALADAEVPLALGTDSHAVIDLFEEARAIELDERLASLVRGTHTVDSLLAAATADGHRSLGWADAGRITVGHVADLVTVRLDSVRTAGTSPAHALATVVFAATAADVDHVIVGGRPVVRDGAHLYVDVAAELAAAITAVWREAT
ncbi:MAG: formimidoylglutamate deiminase [Acidimicrobiaceae bacterium]|nr:formimidoylglutamate deiminase [Acidimicrobiaceae bacterium]